MIYYKEKWDKCNKEVLGFHIGAIKCVQSGAGKIVIMLCSALPNLTTVPVAGHHLSRPDRTGDEWKTSEMRRLRSKIGTGAHYGQKSKGHARFEIISIYLLPYTG